MLSVFNKVVIIGVGLIGGSLAKAAKQKKLFKDVVGIARNERNLKKGIDLGAIDSYTTHLTDGLIDAELVIVATPSGVIVDLVKKIVPEVPKGCIITDVGSIKRDIVRGVEGFIPDNIYFIGGHPIAGKEDSGIDAACSSLFVGHKCILTPTDKTNPNALQRIKNMWEEVGSIVMLMDMEEHDEIFAAVSHLPHIVAFSLINTIIRMEDIKEDIIKYSAGGLKDFTRVAASDPVMWKDIFMMNRENILNSISYFMSSIEELKKAIAQGDSEKLVSEFERSRTLRRSLKRVN